MSEQIATQRIRDSETTEDVRRLKLCDANEPWSIRQKLLEVGWIQRKLYTGDFTFYTTNFKKVGIERKAIPDLVSSLGQRLSEQLYKMVEHFDISILLLEGSWQIARDQVMVVKGVEQWGWSLVWNYLQTWQDKGVSLQLTVNEGHTIKRLNELYAYYQKPSHAGGVTKNIVGDPRLLAFQCGGIGPKIGEALLKKFGSIKAIANADIDDYLEIEKMGKVRAQRLHDHLSKGNSKEEE